LFIAVTNDDVYFLMLGFILLPGCVGCAKRRIELPTICLTSRGSVLYRVRIRTRITYIVISAEKEDSNPRTSSRF
jgi:hypothetical protein